MPADFVTAYLLLAALFCAAGAVITKLVLYIIGKIRECKLSRESSYVPAALYDVDYVTGELLDNDDAEDGDVMEDDWPEPKEDLVQKKKTKSKSPHGYQPLRKGGYNINPSAPENVFKGKTVVFTGNIPWIGRDLAACALSNLGARVTSSISSKTDIVIAGDKPGPSKMEKVDAFRAAGQDIRIMLQWEFAREVRSVFESYPGAKHSLYEIDNDFIVY